MHRASAASAETKRIVRIVYTTILLTLIVLTTATAFILKTKEEIFNHFLFFGNTPQSVTNEANAFPVGVDPARKLVTEQPGVDLYFETHILAKSKQPKRASLLQRISARLTQYGWYQNLASPVSRILVIFPGERKEQVAENFGDILKWDDTEREQFLTLVTSSSPQLNEGKYYPDSYVVSYDAAPETVAAMVTQRFNDEVLSRYTDEVKRSVSIEDALTLASLLEREAYDFDDMRHIAGVIWNRLFIDMHLQIDATLQYAKGNETKWWPVPRPADKYIDSPFNTYQNGGLPPSPISTPSLDAILAALNPKDTECMFYFHDAKGNFHCTPTYEEHVALLKQHYGRGK